MDLEEILYGYLPIVIAIMVIILSIKLLFSKPVPVNSLLGFFVLGLNAFAIYLLVLMLAGSWPSYLPHIAIGIGILLFLVQRSLFK